MAETVKTRDSFGDGNMNETPNQARMHSYAKGGGLMGFRNGGGVLEGGGGTGKGNARVNQVAGSRLAYDALGNRR
tara:strand:- start:20649 stop:20873 length:225 start_codon:yes stop_codon:yes gene_type:complete